MIKRIITCQGIRDRTRHAAAGGELLGRGGRGSPGGVLGQQGAERGRPGRVIPEVIPKHNLAVANSSGICKRQSAANIDVVILVIIYL